MNGKGLPIGKLFIVLGLLSLILYLFPDVFISEFELDQIFLFLAVAFMVISHQFVCIRMENLKNFKTGQKEHKLTRQN